MEEYDHEVFLPHIHRYTERPFQNNLLQKLPHACVMEFRVPWMHFWLPWWWGSLRNQDTIGCLWVKSAYFIKSLILRSFLIWYSCITIERRCLEYCTLGGVFFYVFEFRSFICQRIDDEKIYSNSSCHHWSRMARFTFWLSINTYVFSHWMLVSQERIEFYLLLKVLEITTPNPWTNLEVFLGFPWSIPNTFPTNCLCASEFITFGNQYEETLIPGIQFFINI